MLQKLFSTSKITDNLNKKSMIFLNCLSLLVLLCKYKSFIVNVATIHKRQTKNQNTSHWISVKLTMLRRA